MEKRLSHWAHNSKTTGSNPVTATNLVFFHFYPTSSQIHEEIKVNRKTSIKGVGMKTLALNMKGGYQLQQQCLYRVDNCDFKLGLGSPISNLQRNRKDNYLGT